MLVSCLHLLLSCFCVILTCVAVMYSQCIVQHLVCYVLHVNMLTYLMLCLRIQVVGDKQQTSRLLLCEATAVVMRQCFDLLGMTPMYQI